MIQLLPLNNSLFYLPIKIGDRQSERLDTLDVGAQLDDVLYDARCLRLDALGLSAGGFVERRAPTATHLRLKLGIAAQISPKSVARCRNSCCRRSISA